MREKQVFYNYLTVYDDKVFTKQKGADWARCLLDAYEDVFHGLRNQMNKECPISFQISYSLLEETVADAVIGMRKITESENNKVKEPNAFKVAAYLAYWWLRHKPVYLHYPGDFSLDDAIPSSTALEGKDEKEQKYVTQILRWKLKHINELVAVQFVYTYIFDFSKIVCGRREEKNVKKVEQECFPFEGFVDMRQEMMDKLLYYFSYRAIAPKVIEHILEAYTFHPAWGLTGNLWSGDEHDE